ncbi:MAG: esterase, partial [Luteimonas sp.]|nr:esterase [Luteimonas sp.]
VLRDYAIDPVAQFDTVDLTYQWIDHVLRGAPRPELVRDTVNYQVMGANEWRHAPSLEAAAGEFVDFHLDPAMSGSFHSLSRMAPAKAAHLRQTIDLADRATQQDARYPFPIVRPSLPVDSGLVFATEPFAQPVSVTGAIAGELRLRINKRDFDYNIALYELMADGRAMQLAYAIGRASHARDMATRRLLVPGEWTTLPIERTRMTSRRLSAGSRLVVVVGVLKDASHEVNMGTGGTVADESAADGGVPLTVDWHGDSAIRLPVRQEP